MYKKIWLKISNWINWIGKLGHNPDDSIELKGLKSIITIAPIILIINLLYFGIIYYQMGRNKVALSLLIYAIFFIINLFLFSIHHKFRIIRETFFIGVYLYIITYHILLGGYIGSTGYIDYGIAALVGVHIFYRHGKKLIWFFVYIFSAVILYFMEPVISQGIEPLPDSFRLLAFVNDFILMSCLIFLSIRYFTKKMREEKAKSDVLIHNILPELVVSELKIKGVSHPIMVEQATIIFMDFVNFSKITHGMDPQVLVYSLNEHFTKFDEILSKHNVEKLKTIGDGYMAVGGLPVLNNTHPIDVALAAMEILKYLQNWNRTKEVVWNVRIGIHSGSMIAGIIGKTKFSYDVWGSTVNICSRLESVSKNGLINVSHEFMENTHEFFEFEHRGVIKIKNLPSQRMYFLKDIKNDLRSDNSDLSDKFLEQYEQLANVRPNV